MSHPFISMSFRSRLEVTSTSLRNHSKTDQSTHMDLASALLWLPNEAKSVDSNSILLRVEFTAVTLRFHCELTFKTKGNTNMRKKQTESDEEKGKGRPRWKKIRERAQISPSMWVPDCGRDERNAKISKLGSNHNFRLSCGCTSARAPTTLVPRPTLALVYVLGPAPALALESTLAASSGGVGASVGNR